MLPEQQAAAGFGVPFDWDVELVSGYDGAFLANRARRPGTDRFMGTDSPEIGAIIARERFDAVLVMGWHLRCYWQAIRACRRLGVPVLIRGESQLTTSRGALKRLAKTVSHRWIVGRFDALLYIGSRNRDYLRHYGAADDRLFFCPYIVDNQWFRERSRLAQAAMPELRARLGLGVDERVVLFAGKLIAKKRPLDLVRALGALVRAGRPVRLVVAGSGPLQDPLARLGAELGVRLDLVGFQNQTQMPQWYGLADLLVLPSDGGETWGLVVNEAMACGTPAVVSDAVGCGPDLIEPGTGAAFALGDIAALAEAVRTLVDRKPDPAVQAALAAKMARYSIATAVDGVLEAVRAARDRRRDAANVVMTSMAKR
jgi:glycosyltransferase involved in cell wall biosynthesis